ncbi:signal peptide peptidase SppA [candidate division WOR-3 bacterium]|uniref:Signal peptide peptidase SppA n=1 Tax=candidate division WOR-3 bacterium TaxID=2052148 RepID=A0A937XE51_UNCW3|nr:signal peptide peptidase SppA [candidate division WOR-3 bacterium]
MMAGLALLLALAGTPQMPLSLAGTDDALAVFGNPAGLGVRPGTEFYAFYRFQPVLWSRALSNTTFLAKAGPLAAYWEPEPSRYGIALGVGDKGIYSGIRFRRDSLNHWDLSALVRAARQVSIAACWDDLNHDFGRVALGAAVRPFGNRLTLFGETYLALPLRPMAGLEAEPVDGLKLGLKAFFSEHAGDSRLVASLSLGLGKAGVGAFGTYDPRAAGAYVRFAKQGRRIAALDGKRYVEIELNERIADRKPGFSLSSGSVRTSWQLLDLIDRAGRDQSVGALVLRIDGISASFALLQELRQALAGFRAQGKKVIVYAPSFGMGSYYVASVADRVWTHPLGDVTIPGMSIGTIFLKGTLEKLGIQFDGTRHGKYKSAIETFTEDSLTSPNREQLEEYLDAPYGEFLAAAAAGRRVSRDSMETLVNTGFFNTEEAKRAGLVDTTCYHDQLDSLLSRELTGLRKVSEKQYREGFAASEDWEPRPAVAIVYASGSIAAGESRTDFLTGEMTMGAQTMVRAIRQARNDKRVKALVLRIDSPGGDGFASDMIWRELELCRQKKPVIASMAGVAGSGGYYIACNATRVFALPTTLTGSIGVFNFKLVTEGLYNKLGARRQAVKRGEHADAMSDARVMTPEEDSMMQAQVDYFYNQFVQKVADGRKLSLEKVDSVGQGRIWSGLDAKRIGIVDTLGGFLDAVGYAKQVAKLEECDYVVLPAPKTGFGSMVGDFAQNQVRKVLR